MLLFTLRIFAQLAGGTLARILKGSTTATFRLYPLDCDIYGHMNNASYLRVAELARWRQFAQSGMVHPVDRIRFIYI